MGNKTNTFFKDLNEKATWSAGVAFKRSNALPLDKYSVFETLALAEEYASSNPVAYPGQVIAVLEGEKMVVYVIKEVTTDDTSALALERVGIVPKGDGKTISVSEEGLISLLADGDKVAGSQLTYQADGTIKWVKPDTSTAEGQAAAIKALQDTVDGTKDKEGLVDKVGQAATEGENATPATGLYKLIDDETARASAAEEALGKRIDDLVDEDTTYSVKEGEKILALNGTEFSTSLKINYTDKKIQLLGINDELISEFDASVFVQDSFLDDVSYDSATGKVSFTWSMGDGSIKTDEIDIAHLVDTYTAGNGITVSTDNVISAKVVENDKYLTVDGTGIHTKGIDEAIKDAKEAAEGTAATKASDAEKAAKAYADTELAKKANADDVYTKDTTYTKNEVNDLIDGIQGETTATIKEVSDNITNIHNAIYNESGFEDRIEALEKVGAQANKIESVVAAEGAKITADLTDKTVTINDAALQTLIGTAQTTAESGVSKAEAAQTQANTNKANLETLSGTVQGHTTTLGEHTTKIAELVQADTNHTAEYNALNTTVQSHVTDIANLKSQKADNSQLSSAIERIGAAEGNITTLQSSKANAADVYTKTDIDTKIDTINKGIEDSVKSAKDELTGQISNLANGAVADNTAAIKAIYDKDGENAATGILPTEIARIEEAIAAEVKRSTDIDTDFETRIAEMETFWDAADDPAGTIDKLAEIVDYIKEHEDLNIPASVEANAKAIENIYSKNSEGVESGLLVAERKRIDDILDPTNGIEAVAKAYTDNAILNLPAATADKLGLVKIDNNTITTNESGQIRVSKITEDVVFEGTFILNGGTAKE